MIFVYLSAIVAANLLAARFGPAITPFVAFVFIGLDLVTRDALHDRWRGRQLPLRMAALIATGGLLSWIVNRNAGPIAIASTVAFSAAAVTDGVVYHTLRRSPWLVRVNASNLPAAAVDSFVFLYVAFGVFLPWIVLGQFLAKSLGGFVWSWVLAGRTQAPLPLEAS